MTFIIMVYVYSFDDINAAKTFHSVRLNKNVAIVPQITNYNEPLELENTGFEFEVLFCSRLVSAYLNLLYIFNNSVTILFLKNIMYYIYVNPK